LLANCYHVSTRRALLYERGPMMTAKSNPDPIGPETLSMRDLRRAVDTIGPHNLLLALAAACHTKAQEVGIYEPLLAWSGLNSRPVLRPSQGGAATSNKPVRFLSIPPLRHQPAVLVGR
jgi:hypothetical protein